MPDSACANRGSKTQNWPRGPSALLVASRATAAFDGIWDALDPLMIRHWRNGDTRNEVTRNTLGSVPAAFGASIPHWPAFSDTSDALRVLKHHYWLVVLSPVHRDGIAASNRQVGVEFDAIYTAENVSISTPSDASPSTCWPTGSRTAAGSAPTYRTASGAWTTVCCRRITVCSGHVCRRRIASMVAPISSIQTMAPLHWLAPRSDRPTGRCGIAQVTVYGQPATDEQNASGFSQRSTPGSRTRPAARLPAGRDLAPERTLLSKRPPRRRASAR